MMINRYMFHLKIFKKNADQWETIFKSKKIDSHKYKWEYYLECLKYNKKPISNLDTGLNVSSGIFAFVEKGTLYGSSGWVLTTNSGTVGTDSLTFSQFSGAGSATTPSGGLTINGSGDIVLDTPSNVKSILNTSIFSLTLQHFSCIKI